MADARSPAIVLLAESLLLVFATTCCSSNPGQQSSAPDAREETEGCTPLERGRVFPIVGAFFGPDPGPCSMDSGEQRYFFHYDANSVLVEQVSADGMDTTRFTYADGLLVSEKRSRPVGESETNYQYVEDRIRMLTNHPNGTTTAYEYEVDARGYPREATLLNPVSSVAIPTRYTYEYEDCSLRWRVAYDPNESVNLNATSSYTYDPRGRLATRANTANEERFDYSCW